MIATSTPLCSQRPIPKRSPLWSQSDQLHKKWRTFSYLKCSRGLYRNSPGRRSQSYCMTYMSHTKWIYMEWCIQEDLKTLQDWFRANKLTLNINKLVCICFSNKESSPLQIKIGEETLLNGKKNEVSRCLD